jgi:predicted transcriptional regulator
MKCEIFVRVYLPSIRALLAKELTALGLTQQEAARKLYLTQPAVAFYKGQVRGKRTKELSKISGISDMIEELSKRILASSVTREELEKEYCSFCALIMK